MRAYQRREGLASDGMHTEANGSLTGSLARAKTKAKGKRRMHRLRQGDEVAGEGRMGQPASYATSRVNIRSSKTHITARARSSSFRELHGPAEREAAPMKRRRSAQHSPPAPFTCCRKVECLLRSAARECVWKCEVQRRTGGGEGCRGRGGLVSRGIWFESVGHPKTNIPLTRSDFLRPHRQHPAVASCAHGRTREVPAAQISQVGVAEPGKRRVYTDDWQCPHWMQYVAL